METNARTSIIRGFAWATLRAFACVAFGVAAAAAASGRHLARTCAESAVIEQARLCAAALSPSRGGDLWGAVDRVRSEYSGLAAVATLGARGNLKAVYPPDPVNQAAARAATDAEGHPVLWQSAAEAGKKALWAVVVPLNGIDSPTARRVVVMFEGSRYGNNWPAVAAVWAGAVAVIFSLGYSWMILWFKRRIARPLEVLGKVSVRSANGRTVPQMCDSGGWRETEGICESLRGFVHALRASNEEIERAESEAEQLQIARQRRFENQLRRAEDRATIDPLTGLRNRGFLEDYLERIYAMQRGRNEDLSAVMIDLDRFKQLNDTRGHKAGDELLRFISEVIQGSIRHTDHAIRYGGDEFLVLLPGVSAPEARHIADRIVKLFAQNSLLVAKDTNVTASAGVASLSTHPCGDGRQLIAEADSALYSAKRNGRNTVFAGADR